MSAPTAVLAGRVVPVAVAVPMAPLAELESRETDLAAAESTIAVLERHRDRLADRCATLRARAERAEAELAAWRGTWQPPAALLDQLEAAYRAHLATGG